jgi:hypothetical protein
LLGLGPAARDSLTTSSTSMTSNGGASLRSRELAGDIQTILYKDPVAVARISHNVDGVLILVDFSGSGSKPW